MGRTKTEQQEVQLLRSEIKRYKSLTMKMQTDIGNLSRAMQGFTSIFNSIGHSMAGHEHCIRFLMTGDNERVVEYYDEQDRAREAAREAAKTLEGSKETSDSDTDNDSPITEELPV